MARRAFVVNEAVREQVRHLAGVGVRQDDIATIIGCAPKTLRKHFRDDLDRGTAEANATVADTGFAGDQHDLAVDLLQRRRAGARAVHSARKS